MIDQKIYSYTTAILQIPMWWGYAAALLSLALLVVAADDSIKQQTREHLDILRMLNLPAGCAFRERCPRSTDACLGEPPISGGDHRVRCFNPHEPAPGGPETAEPERAA